MNRSNFLKACGVVAATIAIPFSTVAKSVKSFLVDKGFFVPAGKDRNEKTISLMEGDVFDTKVSTKDGKGDIYVFESKRIKEGGPSHHYHFEQDEWWYVLQGEFIFKVGETIYNAKAGDSVFGPRMVPHSFAKIGEGEAKLLMFFQPAGRMEEFFIKLSQGKGANLSEEDQQKMREEHGFKKVGPPIKDFKKW